MTTQPALSICIPTYNRAELLRSALWALAPQIQGAKNQVEVIVCDNCSTDHTSEVVNWARQYLPIRYYRNEENIGATRNILRLTNHLARGEFGWVLGDDDLVREDGVASILKTIQANPEVDCLFLNHSYEDVATRQNRLVTGADFPKLGTLLCAETTTVRIQRWEEIIDLTNMPALFTSIVSHVFRLSMWRSIPLEFEGQEVFDSLENTFPHVCIVARGMVGKPTVYVGYPHVILFIGAQEWLRGYWPAIMFVWVLELSDLFSVLGVSDRLVDLYRNLVFKPPQGQELFFRLLNEDLPGRKLFSIDRFLKKYWKYGNARILVAQHFVSRARRRLLSPMKQTLMRALRCR